MGISMYIICLYLNFEYYKKIYAHKSCNIFIYLFLISWWFAGQKSYNVMYSMVGSFYLKLLIFMEFVHRLQCTEYFHNNRFINMSSIFTTMSLCHLMFLKCDISLVHDPYLILITVSI